MEKVYFDKEFYGSWTVKNLSDMYSFKYVNTKTDEEKSAILTWKRNPHEEGVGEEERLCSVEIDGEEFLFIEKYDSENSRLVIFSKNPWELERLLKEKNIIFVGETLINEDNLGSI